MPIVVPPAEDLNDVEVILGRALTSDETERLARLIEMAYSILASNLPGFTVTPATVTDERIGHDDPDVAWTARYPVTVVTEVSIDGAVLSPTSYEWTETGRITLGHRSILNEFEINLAGFDTGGPLTVTYEVGLDPTPDEVAVVVAQLVAGVLRGQSTNPDGVTSEQLGAYQVSYGPQGTPGFGSLSGASALLRRWSRSRATSVPLIRRR